MNAQNLILFIIVITIRCDEDFKIRIGLPEYICDKDGGVRDISKDMTTIRLLGKDAQSVSYKFDVKFLTIGKSCVKNQRCTLMKWKAIRELDQYLKHYPQAKFETGVIEINNTMFTPGIKYLINVTLINNNKIIKEQQLTLNYVDDSVREKITKPMASLLLLAPDNTYAYTTYFINAEVNICSNISSYYFNWELLDSTNNITVLPSKSTELAIPPDTLKASQTYVIKCSLVLIEDGSSIAESQQNVHVLSKGLLLRLPVKKITTRTGQDIRVKAYMKDLDNIDENMKISWSCLETTSNEKCVYDSDEGELDVYSSFSIPGIYKISVEISKNNFKETDSCIVEVLDEAPIIEIDEIEFPVDPSQGIEIQTIIYDLHSFCTLQWTSPEQDNYKSLDLTKVPGHVDEIINITLKEDLFLNELEEFSNGTINKKHNLVIPPPNENWDGLSGDTKYLFRLIVTCPSVIEIFDDLNDTIENVKITTTTDVILETNAPPVNQKLEVIPLEGEAFITSFNFKTQKAQDKKGDEPILYKFGYKLDTRDIIVWNLAEIINCEVTLAYSEDEILTFMETCDSFGSCGRTMGPLIKTKFPEINKDQILQRFVSKLESEDYSKAFTEAFIILWSYKSQDDSTIHDFITERVAEEIDKYLNMRDDFSLKNSGNELIKNINDFNTDLKFPPEILDKVVELRNKLTNEPEKYTQRKLLELRETRASYLNLGDVKNYLEIFELIITTSSDQNKIYLEKENMRKQLRNYMEKLCTNMKKTQLSLELKTVIFSVEKLKKNSLNNFLSVPFEGNSWQNFGRIKLGNIVKDSKDKCIGKAIFKDYLDKIGVSYYVDILNTNDINESPDIVIFLPKNKSFEGTPKCLVYYDNKWHSGCKTLQNIAGYVKCNCKHLGYYYLDYTQFVNTAVVTTTTTTKIIATTTMSLTEKNFTSKNESLERLQNYTNGKYDTISYIVIGVSVIGIIILAITVRKIFHDEDENEESDTFDFPKYAQLHNEEFLNDVHI